MLVMKRELVDNENGLVEIQLKYRLINHYDFSNFNSISIFHPQKIKKSLSSISFNKKKFLFPQNFLIKDFNLTNKLINRCNLITKI